MQVEFQHFQGELTDSELRRFGSPHLSSKEVGEELRKRLLQRCAAPVYHTGLEFQRAQILCANEVFSESAIADPLAPGSVYTGAIGPDGTVGLYRLEVTVTSGTSKLKMAGGVRGAMKESITRASAYLASKKVDFGLGREVDTSDFHIEAIDLLNNGVEAEVGVAFFVAVFSALRNSPVTAATMVLGDMSIQGGIKKVRSLTEPLQLAKDNGVKRALVPIENKRQFLEVSGDIMEHVDPVFYGDPKAAAFKALGMN